MTTQQDWQVTDSGLRKTFVFADFRQAMAFAVEAGRLAEAAQHHPDLDIRWNKVQVTLVTHDAGHRVTDKDREMSCKLEGLAHETIVRRATELFLL